MNKDSSNESANAHWNVDCNVAATDLKENHDTLNSTRVGTQHKNVASLSQNVEDGLSNLANLLQLTKIHMNWSWTSLILSSMI